MKSMSKLRLLAALPALGLMAGAASAQVPDASTGIGSLAIAATENLGSFVALIMIGAFLGGLFFAVSAMLKMKDAKENPRDNAPGTIALNWVAAVFLIFLGGGIAMMQGTLGVDGTALEGQQTVTYGD